MNWRLRWARHHLSALIHDSELRVLGLALVCAVAASSAVQLFGDRMARAITAQSGESLGADLIISARSPIDDTAISALNPQLRMARTIHLPSVIWFSDSNHLAGLKAVDEHYPLKGELRTAAAPLHEERVARQIPEPGSAWVDAQLWSELRLQRDATIEVGATTLRVSRLLTYEPDRGSGFVDIAPRLLINMQDLPATKLLQPGSRAQYRVLVSGDEDSLQQVKALEFPPDTQLSTPADARPEIRSAVSRAESFLALASMTASLLGAIAVGLCAHQYGQRLRADVALLRCLGAARRDILGALLISLLAMASVAGGLGAAIGWAVQFLLQDLAQLMLLPSLPPPHPLALAQAWLIALILLAGFALPPLLDATRAAPIAVLRNDNPQQRAGWGWQFAALAGLVGLLALQAPTWSMLGAVIAGQALTAALLAVLSLAILALLRPLRHAALRGWRLGLGNLLRRTGLSIAQSMALGLGLLALLLLTVVRHDLLQGWQNKLPPDTPNQFLINIQSDQVEPLQAFLKARGVTAQRIWPMARARLVAVNDQPVDADSFSDPETQRWINRDFNLSWADQLGDDNRMVEGQFWGPEAHGQALISAELYVQERLGVGIGDTLSLDFAGDVRRFTIHHLREVDWESFQPNFFLLTPPGVLDAVPATWLTSFYLPPEQRSAMRDLSQTFPGVTVLDLDALMDQVRTIMQRIVGALEMVFVFTVAAGLIVLLAAMEAGRHERRREIALMRTLGASRREVRQALLSEFAALGALSGLVAALCAQAVGWVLAAQVFEIPYEIRWLTVVGSAAAGAVLVCALAWLSLRPVTNTPPDRILRE